MLTSGSRERSALAYEKAVCHKPLRARCLQITKNKIGQPPNFFWPTTLSLTRPADGARGTLVGFPPDQSPSDRSRSWRTLVRDNDRRQTMCARNSLLRLRYLSGDTRASGSVSSAGTTDIIPDKDPHLLAGYRWRTFVAMCRFASYKPTTKPAIGWDLRKPAVRQHDRHTTRTRPSTWTHRDS